jgi:hypothetical protein
MKMLFQNCRYFYYIIVTFIFVLNDILNDIVNYLSVYKYKAKKM